jgi:mannonate dehydratase
MNRRQFATRVLGASAVASGADALFAQRTAGLPPLSIKEVRVIKTSAGGRYRWIFLKIITSEPGLYGIGSANNNYQSDAVVAALEKHLTPWLIGKDPSRIEDLWQSSHVRTYWRNGPVNNVVLAALDMALWDIKAKRAGMPVYELLGGKARDAVACYDHQSGNDKESALAALQKSLATGYRHVRIQYGGYGGGGFFAAGEGNRPVGGQTGAVFDEERYVEEVPKLFEYLRAKAGFEPKLCHDAHSHLSGANAVEFSRRLQDSRMFFLEDVLPPEQLGWYKQIREVCTTPQAVGELFTHPFEYTPLIVDRSIDFVRCRVSAIGGITPAKKLATLCEMFGVKTAFQEGGENDPVNLSAAIAVDISSTAFGIQEENHFPQIVHEMLPGTPRVEKGYVYASDRPGLGVDIDEKMAAKYPFGEMRNGGAYTIDRAVDGTVVKP